MLFNSYQFICLFLPVCMIGFYLIYSPKNQNWVHWINLCSMCFYAYWSIYYLLVLSISVCFNYLIARKIAEKNRALLVVGVAVNLAVLGYFKYFNFFIDVVNSSLGMSLFWPKVILPLGISFFTFQKIAFLVDSYQQKVAGVTLPRYLFFVSFFPQLIAGPIVHHSEIFLQFDKQKEHAQNFSIGFSIFCIGLFKKIVIADSIAAFANPVFSFAETGGQPTFVESWYGALAYALQIYFDFSAYSDMAVGLAKIFGVSLPQNFASPYKSLSIIEFWRRWHITLSRFLKDYLYIPLGGNRKGPARQRLNLMVTMLLGGFWHGASFNFIIWGGIHGLLLLINHTFSDLRKKGPTLKLHAVGSWFITMFCVVLAWVPFRSVTFTGAIAMWRSMFMLNGIKLSSNLSFLNLPEGLKIYDIKVHYDLIVLLLVLICVCLPNTCEIFRDYNATISTEHYPETTKESRFIKWRPTIPWAAICILMFCIAFLKLNDPSEFLYFQF